MKMTWEEKLDAIMDLELDAHLRMQRLASGRYSWCLHVPGCSRREGSYMVGGNGKGSSPQEAVENYWDEYVMSLGGVIRDQKHYGPPAGTYRFNESDRTWYRVRDAKGDFVGPEAYPR